MHVRSARAGLGLVALVLSGLVVQSCASSAEDRVEVHGEELSFDAWKKAVRLPWSQEIYAVGDPYIPWLLVGEDEARKYYESAIYSPNALTLHSGQSQPGDPRVGSYFPERATLRYCIDRTMLEQVVQHHSYLPPSTDLYPMVDFAFGAAAAAWNSVAGIQITKELGRDRTCSPRTGDSITWYVKPFFWPATTTTAPSYLALVLPPHQNLASHTYREFLIFEDVLAEFLFPDPMPFGSWFSLEGLMLRTIGQGLGFIDESNRGGIDTNLWPATCRRPDVGGIFLSAADPYSVMVHPASMADAVEKPECVSYREFDYAISYLDAMGAACQYSGQHSLYYCNDGPQQEIKDRAGPECSPVPLTTGSTDCGAAVDWTGPAAGVEAAILNTFLSP